MTETYLGIDFGGTKVMVGEVDGNGHILSSRQYPTGYCSQREAVNIMFNAVDDYLATSAINPAAIKAVGIGLIGRIDNNRGLWLQIDDDRNETTPLASLFQNRYGWPCFVDNDVKCATMAEALWQTGKRSSNFVYINIGTGIGAGAVVDGKLIRGYCFDAGEVGFFISNVSLTGSIGHETIENTAAGIGFDRCARLLQSLFPNTTLMIPSKGRVAVKDIIENSRKGDALCLRLVSNAVESIATLINNLVVTFNPEAVVLGGGVVSDGFILERVKRKLNPMVNRFLTYGITLTRLNPHYIGLLGATAIASINSKEK